MPTPLSTTVSLIALIVFASCYTTERGSDVARSGFLVDYDLLQPGGDADPLEVYVDHEFDFASRSKVHIQEIELWLNEDRSDVDEEGAKMLASMLFMNGKHALRDDFTWTDTPDADTLVVRAALTEIDASSPTFNFLTTVIPQPFVLSTLKRAFFGRQAFVGAASLEAEVLDHATGKRVLAAVDRRFGGKSLDGVFSDVADVEAALEVWAEKLASELRQLRARPR